MGRKIGQKALFLFRFREHGSLILPLNVRKNDIEGETFICEKRFVYRMKSPESPANASDF